MVCPGGVNPNDKTVMINPPGAYHNGGVNENLKTGINNQSINDTFKRKYLCKLPSC